jgi:hypothetical protein
MRSATNLSCVLAALLIAGTFSLATAQSPQPATEAEAGGKASSRVWKSQTTGNEYRVAVEGDVLRADWVNVPPEMIRQGAYVRTECRRVGDKWIGTTRSRLLLPCTEVAAPDGHHPRSWCSLTTRTEIDSIAPERITGRAQAPTRLDCQVCKLLDAEWKDFIWTPRR